MKIITITFLTILTFLTIPSGFSKEEVGPPVVSPLCMKVYTFTASAIKARRDGGSKEKILSTLPTREKLSRRRDSDYKTVLTAMVDITEHVFENEGLDERAYAAFTSENCNRQLVKKQKPVSFSSSYLELKKCNALPEKERTECGLKIASMPAS